MTLPFSAAADRNKQAIGDALAEYFDENIHVLEIGSGTGQHAVYMCGRFPAVIWQPTDQPEYIESLCAAFAHAKENKQVDPNSLLEPIALEVSSAASDLLILKSLGREQYPFIYSANTAHIMSMEDVEAMFALVGKLLNSNGLFALYGPFKIDGEHISVGNSNFDVSLRTEKPHMGIRDKGDLQSLATSNGLQLLKEIAMPANNKILLWQRMH